MDGKISEQRVYIVRFEHSSFFRQQKFMLISKSLWKWCFKIFYCLQVVKVRCFNEGRESIENDPWVGRLVSVLTEKNVATVKMLIEEDAIPCKWHSFVKCFEDLA